VVKSPHILVKIKIPYFHRLLGKISLNEPTVSGHQPSPPQSRFRGSPRQPGRSPTQQVKMASTGTEDFEELQVINIDEKIMRGNVNDTMRRI